MARRLEVEIVGDASSLKRALSGAETSTKTLGSKFGSLAKGAGLVAGAAGLGGLIATVKVGIGEFSEASKVTAQTEAVLKSTGGAAHVSQKQIEGLAGSILKKTGIDDEAIQSGENLLLTFTNIRNEAGQGNDIFNQTTGIMADLSVAMGTDTKSAAMQLGKALNDPATGMSKLSKVGVTFTDGQKEAAKQMVATGDVAGAQKIILGELTKEFGGSAEAAGKTLPGQLNILKETFGNLAGEIVGKMVPAVKAVVDFITKNWGTIETIIGGVFDGIGWAFENVLLPVFRGLIDGGKAVVGWFVKNWGTISDQLGQTFGPFVKLGKAAFKLFDDLIHGRWSKLWGDFKEIVSNAAGAIGGLFGKAIDGLHNLVDRILEATGLSALKDSTDDIFDGLKGQFRNVATAISAIIHGDWGKLKDAALGIVEGIAKQFYGLVKLIPQILGRALPAIIGVYEDLGAKILDKLHLGFLTDGFRTYFDGLKKTVAGIFKILHGIFTLNFGEIFDGLGDVLLGALKQLAAPFVAAGHVIAAAAEKFGQLIYDYILKPIAGLGKALGGALEDGVKAIGKAVTAAARTVAGFGQKIAGWIADAFADAIDFGKWILGKIRDAVVTGASTVAGWAEKVVGWLGAAFEKAVDFGGWILGKIRDAAISGASTVAGWGEKVVGWLKDAALHAIDFAAWILTRIGQAVLSGASTVGGWATTIVGWVKDAFLAAVKFGAWILERIGDAAITGANTVAGWAEKIAGWVKDAFLTAVRFGAWIFERIGDAVISGANTVAGWGEKVAGWVKDAFLTAVRFGAWVFTRIGDAVITGLETVKGWAEKIGGWLKTAFDATVRFGAWVADRISGAVMTGLETVKGWGEKIAGWFESAFKGALKVGAWISDKIHAGWDAIVAALKWLAGEIEEKLRALFGWHSPVAMFEDLGADMMRGLAKGIKEKIQHPYQALKWVLKMMGVDVPSWVDIPLSWADPSQWPQRTVEWLADHWGSISDVLRSVFGGAAQPGDVGVPVGAWPREGRVIAKANEIANRNIPYAVGGGHNSSFEPSRGAPHWGASGSRIGYCCSGSVSAIFHAGDYLSYPMASGEFYSWGHPGPGRFLTTYAKPGQGADGHVFAVLMGLGWGTGGNNDGGPGWYEHDRGSPYRARHPFGSQGPLSSFAATQTDASDRGTASTGGSRNVDGDGPSITAAMASGFTGVMRLPGGGILFGANQGDFAPLEEFAKGTNFAPGGWAMVGEKGPELMYVPRGSQIVPNQAIPAAASSGALTLEARLPVYLDGRQITEVVHRGLLTKKRENGTLGLG